MRENIEFLLMIICFMLFVVWNIHYLYLEKNKEILEVSIVDNKAYWMYNNKLYTSGVLNGKVDVTKKKKIDSMGMSEKDMHDILRNL